jgi:hypothetical protein
MEGELRELIQRVPAAEWKVAWVVEYDYYDGILSGFLVMRGPRTLALAIELREWHGSAGTYLAWLLPEECVHVVASMGSAELPNNPQYRYFTLDAPLDEDAVERVVQRADPTPFESVLETMPPWTVRSVRALEPSSMPDAAARGFGSFGIGRRDART